MNNNEPLQLDNTGTGKIGSIRVVSGLSVKNKMKKILKDTRDHYAADPDGRRSISEDGECMYTWGQNHCAIGRYMSEEFQREDWVENNSSVRELTEWSKEGSEIDWVLRDEVHGLDVDFWIELQELHDTLSYWITKDCWNPDDLPLGLSPDGEAKYNRMYKKIEEGLYDG